MSWRLPANPVEDLRQLHAEPEVELPGPGAEEEFASSTCGLLFPLRTASREDGRPHFRSSARVGSLGSGAPPSPTRMTLYTG
jgi:hypothetical protein